MALNYDFEIPVAIISIVVNTIGIIANCLSLSYFIKRENKGLPNRLFMLLNSCDLAVCLVYDLHMIALLNLRLRSIYETPDYFMIFESIFYLFFDCTGFATCLISVTRTIKVCRPFYSIKGAWISVSFLFFFLCSFGREFTYRYLMAIFSPEDQDAVIKYHQLTVPLGITINVIAVFISTIVAAYWLLKKSTVSSNNSANSRYATVTIITLSTVFCCLNATFITIYGIMLCVTLGPIQWTETWNVFLVILFPMIMYLNSAINPTIYLARKEEMRRHVSETWQNLKKFMTCFRD